MHCFDCRLSRMATLVYGLLLGSIPCLGSDTLKVVLVDGRQIAGNVDSRTDLDRLWIGRTEGNVELVSGFPWAEISSGEVGSERLNAEELQRWSVERHIPQAAKLETTLKQVDKRVEMNVQPNAKPPTSSVKSLAIRAFVGQWDQDAQSDGLQIFVSPLDKDGRLVPVSGQIDFTLISEKEAYGGRPTSKSHPKFAPIAQISQKVRASDFANGPAVYHLAFLKQHPDFDPRIATQALLHARLAIPGRGVFEASDAQVSLREYSRFRDQMQLYSRSRYLPLESGGLANP